MHELKDDSDTEEMKGNVISYSRMKELGKEYNIDTEKDLLTFLEFHHLTADITFCTSGNLGRYVVVDPQWLLDVFRAVITLEEFFPRDIKLQREKKRLIEKGIIQRSSGFLNKLWGNLMTNSAQNSHDELVEYLLALMAEFDLAVKYDEDMYMIPCMLPATPKMYRKSHGQIWSLYYKFHASKKSYHKFQAGLDTEDHFLPQGLFQKLVSRCSKLHQTETGWKWDGATQYQNMVTFKHRDNVICLATENTWIKIDIFPYSTLSEKVHYSDYQSNVSAQIDFLLKTYHRNMWYEFAVNPCEACMSCTCSNPQEQADLCCALHGIRESCVAGIGFSRIDGEEKGDACIAKCGIHDNMLETDKFLIWFCEYSF